MPTSDVEVTNVSKHGFWLLIRSQELFVPFRLFPWFKEAALGQILNVELAGRDHLYWPELDVDLSVESIEHPERFPLLSRARPNTYEAPGCQGQKAPLTKKSSSQRRRRSRR
jgi:hypothetical protein